MPYHTRWKGIFELVLELNDRQPAYRLLSHLVTHVFVFVSKLCAVTEYIWKKSNLHTLREVYYRERIAFDNATSVRPAIDTRILLVTEYNELWKAECI